jgi:hypothetical protein
MTDNPMDELWKAQREMSQRIVDAWRQFVPTAAEASGRPELPLEQMRVLMQAMAELAASSAEPLRALLAAQREMSERLARWAQLQRDLAEEVDALSEQLGMMVEIVEAWAQPMLNLTARLKPSSDEDDQGQAGRS